MTSPSSPTMQPTVFTFYSFKGGVGRTLLAANMAVALARQGRTLLWDLDAEAPSLHRVRALRERVKQTGGFFDWLVAWQKNKLRAPGEADLALFESYLQPTPYTNLQTLPAHGDEANAAALYSKVDWYGLLCEDPLVARDMFRALFAHLGSLGFRHVLIDSRTGLTDLGALLSGVLPHATVLVGGYGAQNLYGLGAVRRGLVNSSPALKTLRAGAGGSAGSDELALFYVASPIPQDDAKLVAVGRELWAKAFGLELSSVLEIRYAPDLPFSEALLIDSALTVAGDYERVAARLTVFADSLIEQQQQALRQKQERPDAFNNNSNGENDPYDKNDSRDPLAKRDSRARQGKRFEERVADLLRLLGYRVQPEQLVGSDRVDLVATITAGVDSSTYFVECKDHAQAVPKNVVDTLAVWLDRPAAKALHARGMVVGRSFSPAAVTAAKDSGIRALTVDDLERQLLDFGNYLSQTVADFESGKLANAYVAQRAELGTRPSRAKGLLSERARPTATSLHEALAEQPINIPDLIKHGIDWAQGRGNRLWVLLGDYGTGKTAFTEKLAYELAKRAKTDSAAPVPLRINLRDFANKVSLEELLAERWLQATGERKDPRVLLHLVERGRIVLLLDSFDEMGIAAAGRSVVEQFRMLVRLTGSTGDGPQSNRVLITCREQFFKEHGDALRAVAGNEDRIALSPLQDVAQRFDAAIDTVAVFDAAQIKEFLQRRLGQAEGQAALKFLSKQRLLELGDRPQLLDIIIQSLPALKEKEAAGLQAATTGALYQIYTNRWLDEYKPTERQSSSDLLRNVLEVLAHQLWQRVGNRMHYGDLYLLVKDRKDLRGKLDPNQLDVELRTAAFLSRTPDGLYGFSHRSFLEYFLARFVERAAGAGTAAPALAEALDLPRLSQEVCAFVNDLVPQDSAVRTALAKGLKRLLAPAAGAALAPLPARVNALILGHTLARLEMAELSSRGQVSTNTALQNATKQYVPAKAQLSGADLSGLNLEGLCAPGIDLSGAELESTGFSFAVLPGANLAAARGRHVRLLEADLTDASIESADFSDAFAMEVVLKGARGQGSCWLNSEMFGAVLEGADFSGADVRCADLSYAQGATNLGGALTYGATAPNATGTLQGLPALVQPSLGGLTLAPLPKHFGPVNAVAYSPDGKTLASGADDNTVRMWDAASGKLLRTLEGHQGRVNSVAYSPDGNTLASGAGDNTVRLWDAVSGKLLRTLEGHQGGVSSVVAYSPDGKTLASGAYERTVRLWDAASGKLLRTLEGHQGRVSSVAYSLDGKTLASGAMDKTVRLWDAASGKLLRTLEGHQDWVRSVAYSPDGKTLASGAGDKTVRLWDAASGKLLRTLEGHQGGVNSLAYSPDGKTLASGAYERTVRLWDAASGKLLRTLEGHQGGASSVAYSPDGKTLISGGYDKTVRLWDAASGKLLRTLEGHQGVASSVAYSPDGKALASGADDNTVRMWDAASGKLLRTLEGHHGGVSSLAYSPDGTTLASGAGDKTVRLWDAASGKLLRTMEGHQRAATSVAYSPDGKTLASGAMDKTVRLWDAASGKLLRTLEGHQNWVRSVAYSPDGKTLASGADDNTVRMWDAASGKLLRTLEGHQGRVNSVAYSPDGKTLASGADDNTVRLWGAASGKLLRTLEGHQDWVRSVAYSPDGKTLASGADDNTVRLWDAASGKLLRTLEGHQNWVHSVAYSPDGKTLASGAGDNTVRLWSLAKESSSRPEGLRMWALPPELSLYRRALSQAPETAGAMEPLNWASLDFRQDARGRWRGDGPALQELRYRDMAEPPQPWPWLPRDWRATDLPELQAEAKLAPALPQA